MIMLPNTSTCAAFAAGISVVDEYSVAICVILGISTTISCSMDYDLIEGKTARLVQLSKDAGATEYLSGPSARVYLDEESFRKEGIKLSYIDYSGYPEYHKLPSENED